MKKNLLLLANILLLNTGFTSHAHSNTEALNLSAEQADYAFFDDLKKLGQVTTGKIKELFRGLKGKAECGQIKEIMNNEKITATQMNIYAQKLCKHSADLHCIQKFNECLK
jgi:hypothetical protein